MGSRKDFIKKTAIGAGGLALGMSAKSYGNILGSNDRIRVAFMGCGRRVGAYYESLSEPYNTELAYICDVKKSQRDKVVEDLKNTLSFTPEFTYDIREVWDDHEEGAFFNVSLNQCYSPG